jgi:glycerol-3-phosphate dehydrogenase
MKTRSQALEVATLREFDLIVIGGGIIGAGIAQDAASRGLSVLIVDKNDFAAGASSRSTKLIHGGFGYIDEWRIDAAKDYFKERFVLEQVAAHIVRDVSFILPITKDRRLFGMKAEIGLTIHDLVSLNVAGSQRHSRVSHKELVEYAPALAGTNCIGGLRFHEGVTDDSRLVIEVLKSACAHGAQALNYMEVTELIQKDGVVREIKCLDRYKGTEISFHCRSCVNACGIWSDRISQLADSQWKEKSNPAKGVHIVVQPSAFETNTALFLPADDKRYVFVVPWQRALLIGCTDKPYLGDLDNPMPDGDEIDYLLHVANAYSGPRKLNRSDVVACWAGLRPQSDSDPLLPSSKFLREHEVYESAGQVLCVVGGKLTNYRLVAGEVVDKLVKKLGTSATGKITSSRTKKMMLGGFNDKNDFLTLTAQISAKARRLGIEPATLDHLTASYGKDALLVVDLVESQPSLNQRVCPDFPQILAEVPFAVVNEMAVTLEDILFRRMRLGMVHQIQCKEAAPAVARLLQELLGWDDARCEIEIAALERNLDEHIRLFASPTMQV